MMAPPTNICERHVYIAKCITSKHPRLVVPARTAICRLTNLTHERYMPHDMMMARLRYRKMWGITSIRARIDDKLDTCSRTMWVSPRNGRPVKSSPFRCLTGLLKFSAIAATRDVSEFLCGITRQDTLSTSP